VASRCDYLAVGILMVFAVPLLFFSFTLVFAERHFTLTQPFWPDLLFFLVAFGLVGVLLDELVAGAFIFSVPLW